LNKKDLAKFKKLQEKTLDPFADLELPKQEETHSYLFDPSPHNRATGRTGQGMPKKRVTDPDTGQFIPNPNEPPKLRKVSITRLLEDKLLEWDKKTLKPKAELIADKLIELAIGGYFPAIQEVLDRIDGKITDIHKIEGITPVTLIFEPAPARDWSKSITVEGETKELPSGDESGRTDN